MVAQKLVVLVLLSAATSSLLVAQDQQRSGWTAAIANAAYVTFVDQERE